MPQQSDRSVATAAFAFAGGFFALLNATVFTISSAPRYDLYATAALCAVVGLTMLCIGARLSLRLMGSLMLAAVVLVPASVMLAPTVLRAANIGLYFLPFFVYLMWFFPAWIARILGYAWIGLYGVFLVARYGTEGMPSLVMVAGSGVVIGELLGQFKKRLERESLTDPLCDVWNRRGFERFVERAVAEAGRSGAPLSLVYFDLDNFKSINDTRGHLEGDRVLIAFANEVRERARTEDVLARFGGDEFALLVGQADAQQAWDIGARLQAEIPEPRSSFGVSQWRDGESPAAFISRADLQMLEQKHQHRLRRLEER